MSNQDLEQDIDRVVEAMLASTRWNRNDMLNMLVGYDIVMARLSVHKAMEIVRQKHGIVFGCMPNAPGTYERKGVEAIVQQAHRQKRAGTRKQERAAQKLDVAAHDSNDEKEKGRIERSAMRIRERIEWGRSQFAK